MFPKEAELIRLRAKVMASSESRIEWSQYVKLIKQKRGWRND
jgi:hypothetical protein